MARDKQAKRTLRERKSKIWVEHQQSLFSNVSGTQKKPLREVCRATLKWFTIALCKAKLPSENLGIWSKATAHGLAPTQCSTILGATTTSQIQVARSPTPSLARETLNVFK